MVSPSNLINIDDQSCISLGKLPDSGSDSTKFTLRNLTQVKLPRRGINLRNGSGILAPQSTVHVLAEIPKVVN